MDKRKFDSGLRVSEEVIVTHLADAWNQFVALNPKEDDLDDFRVAINVMMRIMAFRAIAHMYPDFWNG